MLLSANKLTPQTYNLKHRVIAEIAVLGPTRVLPNWLLLLSFSGWATKLLRRPDCLLGLSLPALLCASDWRSILPSSLLLMGNYTLSLGRLDDVAVLPTRSITSLFVRDDLLLEARSVTQGGTQT